MMCICGELANATYHALQSVVEDSPYRAEIAPSRAGQDEVRRARISASYRQYMPPQNRRRRLALPFSVICVSPLLKETR